MSVKPKQPTTKPLTISKGGEQKASKPLAHSAPTISLSNPPKAPASRPKVPLKDPPPMQLPPSPPVFQGVIGAVSLKDQPISRVLSQHLASSVPEFGSRFPTEDELEVGGKNIPDNKEQHRDSFGGSPQGSLSLFGKSPTIFSLLKEGSERPSGGDRQSLGLRDKPSFGQSLRSSRPTAPVRAGVRTSFSGFQPSSRAQGSFNALHNEEDLPFPLSLDDEGFLGGHS